MIQSNIRKNTFALRHSGRTQLSQGVPECPRVSQSISEHHRASFDNSNFPGIPRAFPEYPRVYLSNETTINFLIQVEIIGAVDLSDYSLVVSNDNVHCIQNLKRIFKTS